MCKCSQHIIPCSFLVHNWCWRYLVRSAIVSQEGIEGSSDATKYRSKEQKFIYYHWINKLGIQISIYLDCLLYNLDIYLLYMFYLGINNQETRNNYYATEKTHVCWFNIPFVAAIDLLRRQALETTTPFFCPLVLECPAGLGVHWKYPAWLWNRDFNVVFNHQKWRFKTFHDMI